MENQKKFTFLKCNDIKNQNNKQQKPGDF